MTMTQPTPAARGRRARRGDGSALSSFLCPVCHHDALVEDVACEHLLLVQDRHGDVYCRDLRTRTLARAAEIEAGGRGTAALERICERLGTGVVLYELMGQGPVPGREESVFFVVKIGEEGRATA
jgi:hypothetical protein